MKKLFSYYSKTPYFSLICIGLLALLYMYPEYRNRNLIMVDYEVFYKAAQRIFHGSNLYQVKADGHFVFKYSPTSSIYFLPFILFSLSVSKIIYWIFLSMMFVSASFLAGKLYLPEITKSNPRKYNSIILLAIASVGVHLQREITLGQVNWVLLVFYLLTALAYVNKKQVRTSIIIATSVFIKPFGFIFLPYFIWRKNFKEIGLFVVFSVLLLFLPLLFYSYSEYQIQFLAWINELTTELGNKQDLASPRIHTIFSLLIRYTPLYFITFNAISIFIYQLVVITLLGFVVMWFFKMGKGLKFAEAENFALLIALIPLLAATSEDAYLFLFPVIVIGFRDFHLMSILEKIILTAGVIFQGLNIWELWGPKLFTTFLDFSMVSIGAILIVGILFRIRHKKMLQLKKCE